MIFLIIVFLSAIITASANLSQLASLDISLVMSGEVWRVFTGHLTHLTWRHYAMDAPVFLIVYLVYRRYTSEHISVYLAIFSAIIVSATVIAMDIHQVYGGLSGISYAAVSALLLNIVITTPRRILPYILIVAFLIYFLFLQGNTTEINVAKEAHLGGILSGIIFELIRRYSNLNQIPSHLTKLYAAIPPR